MYFDDLTSRMAKLVKWLQPQIVSLSVLFWTEQPFELQPPDPSVGKKTNTSRVFTRLFVFTEVLNSWLDNLLFNAKSQKTHVATKFACNLRKKKFIISNCT